MQSITAADSGAPQGVVTSFSYTGDLVANVSGGDRRGSVVVGNAGAELTLLLSRLIGWPGAHVFTSLLGAHGGDPSSLVGDVQGVSNLTAGTTLHVSEAWLQQNFYRERLSFLAGLYDLETEFHRLESASLFLNGAFATSAEFASSGVAGPSTYPNPAIGARAEVDPTPNLAWRAVVLNGVPIYRPDGVVRASAPGDGGLLVGELVVVSHPTPAAAPRQRRYRFIGRGLPRPYTGKVALGAWYYTARFLDLVDTLPDGAPVQHRGSGGVYLVADQTVWSAGPARATALSVFAQVGIGDARVNPAGAGVGGGLALRAPWASRPDDQLGLAVATAINGSHQERALAAAGTPAASETAVELTYLAQFSSWLSIQPDLQLVMHPGGVEAATTAVVLGLRVAMSY